MDPIEHLLTRGVDTIYPTKKHLESVLRSGKKLTLYQGFDPTGTQLHIGHAVGFRKLRQFQDLGHHVIFLIGDGTGLAGDPTGKMKTRGKFMSRSELRENAKAYLMQSSKIVRFTGENPVEIRYNGDWLTELKLENILDIAGNFSLQQMVERDMYQARIKANESINLREFLYPLLQGYDSVVLNVDLELGGSDQTFNMLCGRTLVKNMRGKEKFVMTVPLLTDSRGVKIGKTEGNVIGLTDPPNEFYAKIMSLGDDAIIPCFTLLTDRPLAEIAQFQNQMKQGDNPIILKKLLAHDLTEYLHTKEQADEAQHQFEQLFQKKQIIQSDIPVLTISKKEHNILDMLTQHQFVSSKSEAKRLVKQGAIEVNSTIVSSLDQSITFMEGDILKIGKKRFVKIVLSK